MPELWTLINLVTVALNLGILALMLKGLTEILKWKLLAKR